VKKYVYSFLLVFALDVVVRAQTSNSKYEVTIFGAPPGGQSVWNLPRSVAADGKGTIILLRASDLPVLIYNRNGKLQKSWGNGLFKEAHSVDLDREGSLWITDRADNMVYKFTIDGKQLMALGKKGVSGDNNSTDLFNGASDIAIAPNGDFFVADGQGGNSRVVKFSKDGKFIKAWGMKGSEHGQFDLPHALTLDSKGRLLVVDEQPKAKKPRIQIFDQDGKFLSETKDFSRLSGIYITKDDTLYGADSESSQTSHPGGWKRGIRIGSAKDLKVTYLIPDPENPDPAKTTAGTSAAEGVAVDAKGNVYGAEVGPKAVKKYVKRSGT